MSPSHINAHWHFVGRTAKPPEMPHSIALGLTSRKHKARLTSQTKNIMFISGMLATKPCYKGESLQNSALSFKPIIFPGQKKKVLFWLFQLFFLVTNSLQNLAHSPDLLLRSTACLDIGHGGSYFKVTSNKKADQEITSIDVAKVPEMITHCDYFLQKLQVKIYMENFTC